MANLRPARTVELLAADTDRAWMLSRDAGTSLRARIRPTGDIRPWRDVLPLYADLQIALSAQVPALLGLGAPDQRLAVLPAVYDDLLTDTATLRIDQTPGVTAAEHRRLRELASRVRELCAALAAYGIPESLNHGDLHDGNVFIRDGDVVFVDWGDCSITHPFVSLRTVFVSIEISLGLDDYAFTSDMAELRDLYLAPWAAFASRERLRAAADLASLVAPIVGASGWRRAISTADADQRETYAHPVPELLREFLTLVAKRPDWS